MHAGAKRNTRLKLGFGIAVAFFPQVSSQVTVIAFLKRCFRRRARACFSPVCHDAEAEQNHIDILQAAWVSLCFANWPPLSNVMNLRIQGSTEGKSSMIANAVSAAVFRLKFTAIP